MKNICFISLLFLCLSGCNKDEPIVVTDDDMPPKLPECVIEEMPIATQDSFEIFGPGDMEHGFAEAIKFNKEFMASAFARIVGEDEFTIVLQTYKEENDVRREDIYFIEIPQFEGCYKVIAGIDSTSQGNKIEGRYDRVDDDVIWGGYEVLEEESNFLQIDSLDLVNKFVSGEFMVSFLLDFGFPSYETPEYVRFLNGRFECAIIE